MSNIFDALQRSEQERSGTKTVVMPSVTELLERAERQALMQRDAETACADVSRGGFTDAEVAPVIDAVRTKSALKEGFALGNVIRSDDSATVFELFTTVETLPSAESRLISLTETNSPAAEAFRLLRVRLRHLRKDKPLKKLLITSTSPHEGKSFTSANLACALASGFSEKVLLLEGDLRRPALSQLFNVKAIAGICDYFRGQRSLIASIYRLKVPGIWFLPAGSVAGNPLEIIQSGQLPILMEQLAQWFDWIIIDSPPVLPLADTTALARLVDGIILVARRGITEKRKLKKGLEALEQGKLIGALINSSNSSPDRDYYYYRHERSDQE